MKRIGLVGLGNMGIAMAKNILKSGFSLTGWTYAAVEDVCRRLFTWNGSGWELPLTLNESNS